MNPSSRILPLNRNIKGKEGVILCSKVQPMSGGFPLLDIQRQHFGTRNLLANFGRNLGQETKEKKDLAKMLGKGKISYDFDNGMRFEPDTTFCMLEPDTTLRLSSLNNKLARGFAAPMPTLTPTPLRITSQPMKKVVSKCPIRRCMCQYTMSGHPHHNHPFQEQPHFNHHGSINKGGKKDAREGSGKMLSPKAQMSVSKVIGDHYPLKAAAITETSSSIPTCGTSGLKLDLNERPGGPAAPIPPAINQFVFDLNDKPAS